MKNKIIGLAVVLIIAVLVVVKYYDYKNPQSKILESPVVENTTNQTTSDNVVESSQTQIDSWNNEYHKILVDMKLLDKEIEIANETLNDMFNEKTK